MLCSCDGLPRAKIGAQRYEALLRHYSLKGRRTQAESPNENGDIEQRHHRFKKAVEQALMLRGSSDFTTVDEYKEFLQKLFVQLNSGRRERFLEEQCVLRNLLQIGIDGQP